MKVFLIGLLLVTSFSVEAKRSLTSSDIMKSAFCKEYACDDTSPYKNKEGQMAMQLRLAKDPLNLDLLVLLAGNNLKQLTFKFTNDDSKVDRTALNALLRFLLGHDPDSKVVDKISANAVVKTKKDDLLKNEKVRLEDLTVTAGNVLKKPTIVIEL
jgi:hypothetical protein